MVKITGWDVACRYDLVARDAFRAAAEHLFFFSRGLYYPVPMVR